MEDFFASPTAINPGERSALEISDGVLAGKGAMLGRVYGQKCWMPVSSRTTS